MNQASEILNEQRLKSRCSTTTARAISAVTKPERKRVAARVLPSWLDDSPFKPRFRSSQELVKAGAKAEEESAKKGEEAEGIGEGGQVETRRGRN